MAASQPFSDQGDGAFGAPGVASGDGAECARSRGMQAGLFSDLRAGNVSPAFQPALS
jgi:hypothetical protein